jgi:acyl-CoA thioester hydrolase
MADMYSKIFVARWTDMDFNAHMRNTAYLDLAGDLRMMFFQEHGFPPQEFVRRHVGPVVQRDELEYFREVHLLEGVVVTLALCGLSRDGSRFRIRNEFLKEDGTRVAQLNSLGGWMDLETRKLVSPPPALAAALDSLPRTDDFEEIMVERART